MLRGRALPSVRFTPADARRRAEILLWAIVHGYSQLALTGLLCADENGPALPIEAVMPALFGQFDDPPSR